MADVIDDDADLVWSGPGRGLVRPARVSTLRWSLRNLSLLYFLSATSVLPVALGWVHAAEVKRGPLWVNCAVLAISGVLALVAGRKLPIAVLERWTPAVTAAGQFMAAGIATVAVVAMGPELGIAGIFYIEVLLAVFICNRVWWAMVVTAWVVVCYAVGLAIVDAPAPGEQLLIVLTVSLVMSVVVAEFGHRAERAELAERTAREELADLNRTLEARVAEQVEDLERLGQLRRFLAAQVADVVVSRGDTSLLQPHRQDVVVMFCDLRGFTRFTNSVTADTVVEVLGQYYAAVGAELEAHGATIGGYDGDGIMAYIGDPISRPDAPVVGVAMGCAIGARLDALTSEWRAAGHDLGYGIGLSHGTATLGVVGFDGRFDYTALGAVVNLAARLCADARHGELVIDSSLRDFVARSALHDRGAVDLKGYDEPVRTYAVTRAFAV